MKRLIVKNKAKYQTICSRCGKEITFGFKVHKFRKNWHLNCYQTYLMAKLRVLKEDKKEYMRELRILKKHGEKIVLEGLKDE
jgi:hypothetical protein